MSVLTRKLKKKQKGFTLVELLVTVTIFAILTGVVLFSQSKFNSTILLTNITYDTALAIRQAQTYGINIKNFYANNQNNFVPYGVHFEQGQKSFILFADLNESGVFNGDDITVCYNDDGCVNRYNMTRGSYISEICAENLAEGENTCNPGLDRNTADIVFVRPNPDAKIKTDGGSNFDNNVSIVISDASGESFRKIKVTSNGLIQVTH